MSSRRLRTHGFTLLEMTVVLLLVALMSTVIIQGLRFGTRAYIKVVDGNDADWNVFIAQRFLRSALETAYPFDPERAANKAHGLEGTATRLSFSAAPARSRVPGPLNRYEIFVADDERAPRQHNLLVHWRPDRNGRPSPAGAAEHREIVLENIERVEWSYAGAPCDAGKITWRDEWQGRRELPALVRMNIVFPNHDSRQWSVLIVAPRVTEDAMSWIDRSQDATAPCGARE